ncbi:MAG TPA: VCBS repeat-containing protein, partial [Polyangia bacterium]|nr:VCBS repeat-containing protein [Polyangia bacterium]
SGVALGDVDVDGHVDLVVTNELSGSVRILFGDGHGAFAGTDTFATGLDPIQPVITDINGDGRPDILTADVVGDDVTLLLGACRR